MSEMAADAWFYTREGEKIGPVTFSDLRIKATEAGINPRLDMVWTQGLDGWKPAGEIEGLFERRAQPEPAETVVAGAHPNHPSGHESAAEEMSHQSEWSGARRRSYIFFIIAVPVFWQMGYVHLAKILTKQFGGPLTNQLMTGIFFVLIGVLIYFGVRRLINLGMSGWWWLGNLIPFLNLWLGYRCFAAPSGYAYHKKLDGIGIFLAIIYWLEASAIALATGLLIAALLGSFGDTGYGKYIREAYQKGVAESRQRIEKLHQ